MISEERQQALIDLLRKAPIVEVACKKIGISRATYYRWRQDNPSFAKESDDAIKNGYLLINDLAESHLIAEIQSRKMSAIAFWLKHNHPNYSNKLEISGNIRTESEGLSNEQKELISKALQIFTEKKESGNEQKK